MSAYVSYQLIHSHLPTAPSAPNEIPEVKVPTDISFPDTTEVYNEPLHREHATSTAFNPSTSILARALCNSYVLELRNFSPVISTSILNSGSSKNSDSPSSSTALRISFPNPIRKLSDGCVIPSVRDGRLYVILVTETNVLYRLNFAMGRQGHGPEMRFKLSVAGDDWWEEFYVPEEVVTAAGGISSWKATDEDSVALGTFDGGIIRVMKSGPSISDPWTASYHRASSRLRIGSLFSRSVDEQVISMDDFQHEDQLAVLYTFSRDSKLRTWSIATGQCLKTTDVRSTSTDLVVRSQQHPTPASMIEIPSTLLRVVPHPSSAKYSHLVVVFVGTPFNASSAGSFIVYRASNTAHSVNDLVFAGERVCPSYSVGAELRGFQVVPPLRKDGADGWRLWAVWDQKGVISCDSVRMNDIFRFTPYYPPPNTQLLEWQKSSSDVQEIEELDAAYFDNILGLEAPDPTNPTENSDISETFISHLLLPGRFSTRTLTTALDEYIDQLPRRFRDAQMGSIHRSLSDRFTAAVGCQLEMAKSPQTGAHVVDAYRKSLKLDWLGIWARVRELDKQARWPLATSVIDNQLLVLAREGVGAPILEDDAGVVVRLSRSGHSIPEFMSLAEGALRLSYPVLAPPMARQSLIAVSVAGTVMTNCLLNQEIDEGGSSLDALVSIVDASLAAEITQPVEMLAGDWWEFLVDPYLTDEDRQIIRKALSECSFVPRALQECLDLLSKFSLVDGTIQQGLSFAGVGNSLITSAIIAILKARYTLARNVLFAALFHLSESTSPSGDDDNSEELIEILARAFVLYQRYRTLKWLSVRISDAETVRERRKHKRTTKTGDDMVSEFGSLRMREGAEATGADSDGYDTAYSLLHSLLTHILCQNVYDGSTGAIFTAAASFLNGLNVIQTDMIDVEPENGDTRLAYDILVDGHPKAAMEFTGLYPPSSGMAYVTGRACLEAGLVDKSIPLLQKASAGCLDGTLQVVSPDCYNLYNYYRHVLQLVDAHGLEGPVAHFGQLALENANTNDQNVKDLWTRVFLAKLSLGQYEDAYCILTSAPFLDFKRDLLGQLISAMCEANAVGRLNSLGFIGFQKDVEERLNYKARNSDPLRFPNYYKVLYSWHISRGDYRSAAEIMYAQGRRLSDASSSKIPAFEIAAMQAKSYLAAVNALALVEKRNAWFTIHVSPSSASSNGDSGMTIEITNEIQKRRKISSHIPEDEFTRDMKAVDIVTLSDVQAEYTAVLSQLRLSNYIQNLHEQAVSLSPSQLVGFFTQRGLFDLALSAAASLQVDMTDLFQTLAVRCVELFRLSDLANDSSAAAFLQTSPITARLRGPPAARALRYLEVALTRHDSAKTNYAYREAVANTLFEMNRDKTIGWKMPSWLVEWEMGRDPDGWISMALKWGWVEEAVGWATDLLQNATPPELLPQGGKVEGAACIPYSLIDRVLAATAEGEEKDDPLVQSKAHVLRAEVKRRIEGLKRVQ